MELDFPRGFKFAPTDYEIIVYYLVPKIQKDAIQDDTIVEQNVYATDPGFLNWTPVPYLKNHERYYFVRRERLATKNGGRESKRAKRTLESEAGFWKLSTGKHMIKDHQGTVIGVSSSLNYFTYQDPTKKDRDQALKSTRWLMTEYKLPGDDFQEWTVCKIKDRERENQRLEWVDQLQQQRHQVQNQLVPEEQEQEQEPGYDEVLMQLADHVINTEPKDLYYIQPQAQEENGGHERDNNAEILQPAVQRNPDAFAIANLSHIKEYAESDTALLEDWSAIF